jgi:kinesin family protein 22
MVVIHGNRIIEIEWAFKNNKDYVPSPKPSRKSKNKRKAKSHLGRENTAMGEGMQVDRDGRSEAADFGMEITNTESPVGSKRSLEETKSTQTPLKRQKRMNIATPMVQVSSDDECGPPAVVKKDRRMAVV